MKKFLCAVCVICGSLSATAQIQTNAGIQYLQCMQKDMSTDFCDLSNTYFLADSLVSFDAAKGEGQVQWKRYRMSPRQAFNLNGYWPVRMQMLDFPDAAYENDPALKIKIEWVSPRTARVRMLTTPIEPKSTDLDDPMFCDRFKAQHSPPELGGVRGGLNKGISGVSSDHPAHTGTPPNSGGEWLRTETNQAISYSSVYGQIEIQKYPFRLVVKDAKGKILTQTRHIIDND